MTIRGKWSQQLWAEQGDLIRVIGTFCPENKFTLVLDDNDSDRGIGKTSMIIVEPYILIPTTQITKAFPCAR
jgi:hypothetical protein